MFLNISRVVFLIATSMLTQAYAMESAVPIDLGRAEIVNEICIRSPRITFTVDDVIASARAKSGYRMDRLDTQQGKEVIGIIISAINEEMETFDTFPKHLRTRDRLWKVPGTISPDLAGFNSVNYNASYNITKIAFVAEKELEKAIQKALPPESSEVASLSTELSPSPALEKQEDGILISPDS